MQWVVNASHIGIEASALTNGYVALGFSPSGGEMIGSYAVIGSCGLIQEYRLAGKNPASIVNQTTNLSGQSCTVSNGNTIIRYIRPRVSANYAIPENLQVTMIWATHTENTISYHGDQRGSFPVNLARGQVSSAPTMSPTLELKRQCEVVGKLEPGAYLCKFSATGIDVEWSLNSTMIALKLSAPTGGWVGFGFGSQMVGSTAQIGWCGGGFPSVSEYKLNGKSTGDIQLVSTVLKRATCTEAGGTTTVEYLRDLNSPEYNIDPSSSTPVVYAYGGSDGLSQHTQSNRGLGRITFNSGESSVEEEEDYVLAHSTCMWLGFSFCWPLGMFAARYYKPFFSKDSKNWFYAHGILQTIGLVLIIPGFALGIKMKEDEDMFVDNHGKIGLALFICGVLQWFAGVARPHKDSEGNWIYVRIAWEYGHKIAGFMIVIFGFLNVFYGLREDDDSREEWMILHSIWVVLVVVLCICIELCLCYKVSKGDIELS